MENVRQSDDRENQIGNTDADFCLALSTIEWPTFLDVLSPHLTYQLAKIEYTIKIPDPSKIPENDPRQLFYRRKLISLAENKSTDQRESKTI